MADARTRRTGEQNPQIVKLIVDVATMREHIAALEARVSELESALASARGLAPNVNASSASASGKRLGSGPPPLPKVTASSLAKSSAGGRRSVVDISEMAEMIDSIAPPPSRPSRK